MYHLNRAFDHVLVICLLKQKKTLQLIKTYFRFLNENRWKEWQPNLPLFSQGQLQIRGSLFLECQCNSRMPDILHKKFPFSYDKGSLLVFHWHIFFANSGNILVCPQNKKSYHMCKSNSVPRTKFKIITDSISEKLHMVIKIFLLNSSLFLSESEFKIPFSSKVITILKQTRFLTKIYIFLIFYCWRQK